MKKFSKIFAIFTLVALLVTSMLPVSVFAEPVDEPRDITFKGSTTGANVGDLSDWEFVAYKLFDMDIGVGPSYLYTLETRFADFLCGYFGTPEDGDDPAVPATEAEVIAAIANMKDNPEAIDALAAAVWDFINADSENPLAPTESGNGEDGIEGLTYGYYLIYGKNSTTDTISRYILMNVDDETTNEVTIKNLVPEIKKEVWDHNTGTDTSKDYDGTAGDAWADSTDLHMGDTAYFKITTTVDAMEAYKYTKYYFAIRDTMSKGLSFIGGYDNIEVYINDAPVTRAFILDEDDEPTTNYNFTLTKDDVVGDAGEYTDGTKITLAFDPDWFLQYANKGVTVELIYKATVNENAVIGIPGNPNDVELEYSNNPNPDGEGETGTTPGNETRVYTFDIEVFKHTGEIGSDAFKPLPGAEFALCLNDEKDIKSIGSAIGLIKLDDETREKDGEDVTCNTYRVAEIVGVDSDSGENIYENDTIFRIISPESGWIIVKGLDAGTYYMVETGVPYGYNGLGGNIKVEVTEEIDDDDNLKGYDVTYTDVDDKEHDGNDGIWILNNAGLQLPGTGGMGRTIFILVGSTMIGAGLISLVVFRKKIFGAK